MLPKPRLTLLAAALLAANLAHAAPTANAPFTPEQQQLIRQISASEATGLLQQVASAAAANVAKTIEGEKQAISASKEWLEVGRKNVDWWLGFLSLLLAGAAIYVWRTNEKSRQEWDALRQSITTDHQQNMTDANEARKELRQEMQDCIKDAKDRFDQHLKFTETSVDFLKRDLEQARQMLLEIRQHRDSAVAPPADAPPAEIEAAMQTNQSNAAHSPQSKLAALAQQFGKDENWQEAASRWQALTDLEPENREYWFNYGYVLNEWMTQLTEPLDVQRLAKQADTVWRKTIALQATAAAYSNWGNILSDWAKTLTGEAQQQRFAQADQRYAEATCLQPDHADAYYNWGNALTAWANTLTGEAQQQRFAEADQRYAEATRLKPDDAAVYNNWGNALLDWANTLTGKVQQQHFDEANHRFAEATHLKPDYALAYNNWGNALSDWANTLTGDAQQQRFAEADQRFAEATRLKPDDADAYNNWGNALIHWAHALQGDERTAKLDEAERVLLLAKEKGSKNLYNLACIRTLQQRPDEARTLLQETRAAGFLPDHAHLSSDKDLDNLRELGWFKALLAEVKQEEERQTAAV